MSDKGIGKSGAPVQTVHTRLQTDVGADFGAGSIVTPEGENVNVARIERNESDRIFVGVDGARYLKIEKAGDSLSHVARRYNCTLQELKTLNPGLRRSNINSHTWANKPRGDFDFLKLDADFVKLPQTTSDEETQPEEPVNAQQTTAVESSQRTAPQKTAPTETVSAARKSLDTMLRSAWGIRQDVTSPDQIYHLYSAPTGVNAFSLEEGKAFPKYYSELKKIADGRPSGSRSNIRGISLDGNQPNEMSAVLDFVEKNGVKPEAQDKLEKSFFRFERPHDEGPIRERVYINAKADHATEIMSFLVGDILDKPEAFPGVSLAIIAGPGSVGARSENIVVYTASAESAQLVVTALESFQKTHPGYFGERGPTMSEPVLPGVSRGAEPSVRANPDGRHSFGSLRSAKIFEALVATYAKNGTFEDFEQRVDEGFRAAHIDPRHPDRNLGPTDSKVSAP